jgi:2-iminobutanoate/2-iminopropanoate deaminase
MLTQVEREILVPKGHSRPVGAYAPGIAIPASGRRLVFITGQVATDAQSNVLCPDDPAGQTRVVFDRMAAVLAEAGGTLNDLVSVTIYVTDLRHFDAISGTRNEVLKNAAPSSTLVQVVGLVETGCLVEISGMALV